MRRAVSSITGRIVLAALATGIIAAFVSAAISIVVVDRIVDNQARAELRSQAVALARIAPDRARALARLPVGRDRFAVVGADGRVTGVASAAVTPRIRTAFAAGASVSRTQDVGGRTVLLEAVPAARGGGVVGVRADADVRASTALVLRGLLVALAAGVIAALVAGLIAGRRLGAPLGRLASDARRLARGDRGISVAPQRVPEIEDIAASLRALDRALSTSEGRQREFLLSISHELRTPLTALRGYAEALADGVVPSDQVAQVGATLLAESDRLTRFTTDLLELARLEADDFRIAPASVRLDSLLGAAAEAWRAAAERGGVDLRVDSDAAEIRTDPQRLRQVVDGLVENALRVAPAGSRVRLSGRALPPSGWEVAVEDEGPGLDADDLARAFDRGHLRDRYRDERPVGSGLGLSIARRLVERLGGTIEVRQGAAGGATFVVRVDALLPDPDSRATGS